MFLFLCFPSKFLGQEFQWAYATDALVEYEGSSVAGIAGSAVQYITVNNNDEIYAAGHYWGSNDFGDGQEDFVLDERDLDSYFIIKLDEEKNVLWVKKIGGFGYGFHLSSITLDINENLVIGGYIKIVNSLNTTIFLDPVFPFYNPSSKYENLSVNTTYGFVLKLDSQGNYIESNIFENKAVSDVIVDNNNDIVVVGNTEMYMYDPIRDRFTLLKLWAYVFKLDSNLNIIWEKIYDNHNEGDYNSFDSVECDNQNNIYFNGNYLNNFTFGDITYSSNSKFVCKLTSTGNEEWIIPYGNHLPPSYTAPAYNTYGKIEVDIFDNIYFSDYYLQAYPYYFNNTTIDDLPHLEGAESVIFKIDVNGNHTWNIPLYGTGYQRIYFDTNGLGEVIMTVNSSGADLLYYKNQNTSIQADGANSLLFKIDSQGELLDFKRLDVISINSIESDTNNNILLGGSFNSPTDFDPHPFNEYMIIPDMHIASNGNSFYERLTYILKLSNCDEEILFEETYNFCSITHSNPTIGDIRPRGFNIKWYSSMESEIPLDDDFEITVDQVYYFEKGNCSVVERYPVLMTMLTVSPPMIEHIQPCYYENMKLSDINIQGQNLLFYNSLESDTILPSFTSIVSEAIYYVSQTINNCESERISFSFSDLFGSSSDQQLVLFCKSGNNDYGFVNLSEYNHLFISQNSSEFDYIFSYFTSYNNAFENENQINNYQSYQATDQTSIYIRIFSLQYSCYKVAELVLQISLPVVIEKIEIEDWTDTNNSITVFPYDENYLYSLDGIMYQTSNYFENLEIGYYSLYVKDQGNCSEVSESVYLLSYPKFFTPNGDGINDEWRVKFSQFQFLVDIEIYDRYGKFITFFDKDSTGWDGRHKGVELPATDYWFKVIRISDRKIIYRGHFSLVR